jgi:ABC-2 type transport system permease protein
MNTMSNYVLPGPGLATEIAIEWRKAWRQPAFAIPALCFPVMFYLLFTVLIGGRTTSYDVGSWFLASYGAFGVIGPGLFSFGIGLATERDQGFLKWRTVFPAPLANYFIAKLVVSAMFALMIVATLLIAASTVGGVKAPVSQVVSLTLVLGLGSLPFAALGLAAGAWLKGQSAPGILNGIYLPTAALSGLWFPLFMLPGIVQKAAIVLPPYHLGQLAHAALGRDDGRSLEHAAALLLTTLVGLWLAGRGLRRRPY